jgi:DUF1126 PH-like domain
VKDAFSVGPTVAAAPVANGKATAVSLLDLAKMNQPELLKEKQRPKNSKFGPELPREGLPSSLIQFPYNMKFETFSFRLGVKLGAPTVPAHVLTEKQVLRFYGQFKEERPWDTEGPLGVPKIEKIIARNISILYHLEDDAVSILEGKADNGMSGGTFLKRGQLKKKNGDFFTAVDFAVGNTVKVVGQSVLIYDADKNTRDYFRQVLKVRSLSIDLRIALQRIFPNFYVHSFVH